MIYVITNAFPFALKSAKGLLNDVGFGKYTNLLLVWANLSVILNVFVTGSYEHE